MTKAIKHHRIMQGPYPDDSQIFPMQAGGQFRWERCKADIFFFAEDEPFMRNQAFKPDFEPILKSCVR